MRNFAFGKKIFFEGCVEKHTLPILKGLKKGYSDSKNYMFSCLGPCMVSIIPKVFVYLTAEKNNIYKNLWWIIWSKKGISLCKISKPWNWYDEGIGPGSKGDWKICPRGTKLWYWKKEWKSSVNHIPESYFSLCSHSSWHNSLLDIPCCRDNKIKKFIMENIYVSNKSHLLIELFSEMYT